MRKILLIVFFISTAIANLWPANITQVTGKPEVFSQSGNIWQDAKKGTELNSSDKIRCGRGARAEIVTQNGHKIKIWPHSQVSLDKVDSGETKIRLLVGRLRSMVKKLRSQEKFEVQTPVAVCSVRGTDFSVELDEANKVKVEVYEGQVAAKEENTGSEVMVGAGQFTAIEQNQPPAEPKTLPEGAGEDTEVTATEDAAREESKNEVFQEISKEDVMARAAEEIKLAEYQNGKALVDVSGHRVRLEEYIVRSQPNEFKYVVLNTRDSIAEDAANPGNGHFNFGKIIFTFNSELPQDLTLATKNMSYYEGTVKPSLYLTDVLSVMSNTVDQVNEEASGGNMFPDNEFDPRSYTHGFGKYSFHVNNSKWWEFSDKNSNGMLESGELTYYNAASGASGSKLTDINSGFQYDSDAKKYYYMDNGQKVYFNEASQPDGEESFHFYQKNNYTNSQWISTDDYIINDEGKILTLGDASGLSSDEMKQKAYESNFERVYNASVFEGRKIDLVFSAKLLIDAGIITLPAAGE